MKKLAIILAFVAVFASSCKQIDSPYITEPTKLNFVIDELSDGFVSIRIIPKDYRAYYFIAPIMNTEQFVELGLTNEHFMMLCIDQTYTDYLEWRHPYLYDSVPYISKFTSHNLIYGESVSDYMNLAPNMNYILCAFCVHPETRDPIGELQRFEFKTPPVDRSTSPMQLDFRVDMTPNVESGAAQTKVSIRPSINGQPTKRPYFTGIITKAELDKDYGGDLYNYVAAVKEMANHLPDEELRKFLGKDIINESIPDLDPNEEYYVFAAPYVYAWPYSLFFTKFKYSKGVIYPYTHEQYDASEILL